MKNDAKKNSDSLFPVKKNQRNIAIVLMGVCLIIVILLLMMYKKQNPVSDFSPAVSPQNAEKTQKSGPFLKLVTQSGRTAFNKGDEVRFVLMGSSDNQEVGGYDAVISYNNKVLEYKKSINAISTFDTFIPEKRENNQISISAAGWEKLVFDSTPLAEIIFIASEKGASSLDFVFTVGETHESNMTQFSEEGVSDILQYAENAIVYVGTPITIKKGETYTIPDSDISLTAKEMTMPSKGCNDCFTTADIIIRNGDQNKEASFAEGGLAGERYQVIEAYSYGFQSDVIASDSLTLTYYPLDKNVP